MILGVLRLLRLTSDVESGNDLPEIRTLTPVLSQARVDRLPSSFGQLFRLFGQDLWWVGQG